MNFEKGYLYHIFNQGNNSQKIFFERENYLFFLTKVKTHITPFADILAWCFTLSNNFKFLL
jgi:putative transposase